MDRLDQELAEAIADGEAVEAPAVAKPSPRAAPENARRSLGLVLMLLTMGGGLVALVVFSMSVVVYSKGVDELVGEQSRLAGRNVRVEGTLVKGTLTRREEPCEYRFLMEKNGVKLPVSYAQCSVPDTFRDVPYSDVVVTAEGRLDKDGHFEASMIMAKCPSKYEGNDSAMGGPPHVMPTNGAAPQTRVD